MKNKHFLPLHMAVIVLEYEVLIVLHFLILIFRQFGGSHEGYF